MKKKFLTTIIILLIFLVSLMTILSTVGFKTDRFNKFITDKIIEKNKSISLELEEIKFKFDFKDFDLFLETKNPKLIYKNIEITTRTLYYLFTYIHACIVIHPYSISPLSLLKFLYIRFDSFASLFPWLNVFSLVF